MRAARPCSKRSARFPEYYLTRTEIAILEEYAGAIARHIGAHCRLVELGSGSSRKVRILLEALEAPAAYVPVDISREHLREAAARLAADFPELPVIAVCADYTRPFPLPPLPGPAGKRVGFFPGSTIGNFEPEAVVRFLAHCAELLGPEGEMLIGVDLKKDPAILNAAYNDRAGLNAAFNLNLLERINRELGGDIDVDRFEHLAFYSEEKGRMELYLKSLADQTATIAGHRFPFRRGRADPHRELIQIRDPRIPRARPARRLPRRPHLDRPRRAVQRALLPPGVGRYRPESFPARIADPRDQPQPRVLIHLSG